MRVDAETALHRAIATRDLTQILDACLYDCPAYWQNVRQRIERGQAPALEVLLRQWRPRGETARPNGADQPE